MRKPAAVLFVLSLAVLALALVPAAGLAAKGGNAGSRRRRRRAPEVEAAETETAGALLSSWCQIRTATLLRTGTTMVTFNVSTTATNRPWVRLDCYQSGTWVSVSDAGYFPEYPWAPNFTLASGAWTSGAGDCSAQLYMGQFEREVEDPRDHELPRRRIAERAERVETEGPRLSPGPSCVPSLSLGYGAGGWSVPGYAAFV